MSGITGTIEAVANGLGAQSMVLLCMAIGGEIPATVSITADTGSELDRVWSTGERTTAREYFARVVVPLCSGSGLEARFIRARNRENEDMPSLIDYLRKSIAAGDFNQIKIPLFGSRGGRLKQSCTQRWKVTAINQEARRQGATKLITAQGIHFGEADRRVKGRYIGKVGEFSLYQDTIRRKGREIDVKWCQHYYPLVDRRMKRQDCVAQLEKAGIPYLLSSECDMCPHQDLARWNRHTPETLVQIAGLEAEMNGKFFFTDERIPLLDALAAKESRGQRQSEIDFGCENAYCGI